jgi:sigma-B regulation protein RsbU (phosphoserine phosphatase)
MATALARRLSRPIDALVAFAERLGAGALDDRASPEGPIEVQALGQAMNRMAGELAESREQLIVKERLEHELEISSRIQTCILPRGIDVDGLELSARMIPAAEVGGDYYDVLPVRGGTWIGIGDVAGHGLSSGLIMLMLQSAVSALVREHPLAAPSEVLRAVNRVLYENIRHRLGNNEHVTLTLLRYRRDGLMTFAGAHEEIVVWRAVTGRCELVATPGPWVGAMDDIGDVTVDTRLKLEDGDVVVLYTDGITEARDESGEVLGIEPITRVVEALHGEPVERIRDQILRAVADWAPAQEDDMTVMVLRYRARQTRIA